MYMLYYAMLCYAMLCYAMLCYAMLCYATLRYAMLCYAYMAIWLCKLCDIKYIYFISSIFNLCISYHSLSSGIFLFLFSIKCTKTGKG